MICACRGGNVNNGVYDYLPNCNATHSITHAQIKESRGHPVESPDVILWRVCDLWTIITCCVFYGFPKLWLIDIVFVIAIVIIYDG